jgi:hypothetical protein
VSTNIKILGQVAASKEPARPAQASNAGFKNLKLPESIIGAPKSAATAALPAAANGGAQ